MIVRNVSVTALLYKGFIEISLLRILPVSYHPFAGMAILKSNTKGVLLLDFAFQ